MDRPEPTRSTATGWHSPLGAGESGGSQPHRFHTDLGVYLVKTANNPQGPRVLVNELVAGLCLDWLGVSHPRPGIVELPKEVLLDSPGACFADGTRLQDGYAFGSEYWQSDPRSVVPESELANRADVAGTIVLDTWLRPFDGRQSRVRESSSQPGKYDYIPVDHGHSMGNPNWTASGLAADRTVEVPAAPITLKSDDLAPFVERLRSFSVAEAGHIVNEVPEEWITEEERKALSDYLVDRAALAAAALAGVYNIEEGVA